MAKLGKGLEVRLFIDNLTKARYYDEAPSAAFGIAGTAATPRTCGATVGYSF